MNKGVKSSFDSFEHDGFSSSGLYAAGLIYITIKLFNIQVNFSGR